MRLRENADQNSQAILANFELHIMVDACKSMHFLTRMYVGVAKLFILTGQLFILFIFIFYSLFSIYIFLL